jgi:thiamine monophosphate kinase
MPTEMLGRMGEHAMSSTSSGEQEPGKSKEEGRGSRQIVAAWMDYSDNVLAELHKIQERLNQLESQVAALLRTLHPHDSSK